VFVRPYTRVTGNPPGPLQKLVAGAVALALVVTGVVVTVDRLTRSACGDGLQEQQGECVGLLDATAESPAFLPGADGPDARFAGLVADVARENRRVRDAWHKPSGDAERKPFVRVALLLPFTPSDSGAMTAPLIEESLAGAYTAQREANSSQSGVNFQLLLGNIGTDLSLWKPAVDAAAALTGPAEPGEDDSPLVAAMGLPNSERDTQDAAVALSNAKIPSVSGVLSSPDINAKLFFKVAPNNRNSVTALSRYLKDEPGRGKGYLVWDSREKDNYVANTKAELEAAFGSKYRLRFLQSRYTGTMGPYEGAPHAVATAANSICRTHADTVFVAGRDWDLPYLVDAIANNADCRTRDRKYPIRILRVSTGLTARLTTDANVRAMHEANVITVNAAPTDAPSWLAGQGETREFDRFAKKLTEYTGLKAPALADGYAIMHYDAFQVVTQALTSAMTTVKERRLPSKHDITNTIQNMQMLPGTGCQGCVHGASGDFGFTDGNGNWPVCKPVPVVVYPRPTGYHAPKLYRTGQAANGSCPG
jgi:ABC-type branched-subunit amino acid transport system substrate-binding protein